jgi:hypothetical protein
MKKWLLGMLLGGFLGVFDGLSALVSAPETESEIVGIIVGSTIKGLITGWMIGFFAQRVRSLPACLLFGLAVGAFWAFLVALLQYLGDGRHYWWQIMLPGSALGVVVGYATQRYGWQAKAVA